MLTFQGREKGTAKVLILDNDTTQSIAVAYSQSEILDYDGLNSLVKHSSNSFPD